MSIDLSLVSIDELFDEIDCRVSCLVAAYELRDQKNSNMEFRYGKGNWFQAVRLSAVLNNDCLNNWNGELKVLQRMIEDDKELE